MVSNRLHIQDTSHWTTSFLNLKQHRRQTCTSWTSTTNSCSVLKERNSISKPWHSNEQPITKQKPASNA